MEVTHVNDISFYAFNNSLYYIMMYVIAYALMRARMTPGENKNESKDDQNDAERNDITFVSIN